MLAEGVYAAVDCHGGEEIKKKIAEIKAALKLLKTAEGRREVYSRYKEIILYFVFGVGTTIISFGSYYLLRWIFPDADSVPAWLSWIFKITSGLGIESSTALPVIGSWVFSVTFAFLTNRVYVFNSSANTFGRVLREAVLYYASRLVTLIMDLVIMFLLVDLTGIENPLYEFVCKVFSNMLVLIANFVLSKVMVFRKKKEK